MVRSPYTVRARGLRAAAVAGLLALFLYAYGLIWLSTRISYGSWAPLVIGPVLICVSLPALARWARRAPVPNLFPLLVAALIAKVAFGAVGYYVDYHIYHAADATLYYKAGLLIAQDFRHFDFALHLHPLVGTGFIDVVTGAVLTLVGTSKLGGFIVFSWLGFWGLYFFYRAFVEAVPDGNHRLYAVLLFFMPTLLFWPSEIGKDAWMMLGLGLAAFGAAKVLTGHIRHAVLPLAIGMWMQLMVRPPMAGALAIGLVAGALVRRPRPEWRELAPVAKVITGALALVLAVYLAGKAQSFLKQDGVNIQSGLGNALQQVGARTAGGGSSFPAYPATSPLRFPLAFVTVMFRPLIFEAHSLTSLLAGAEGTALLLFSLIRTKAIWGALRSVRERPYLLLAVVYTIILVVGLSGLTNFGTMVRERSQVMPLYFALLAYPAATAAALRAKRPPETDDRASPVLGPGMAR